MNETRTEVLAFIKDFWGGTPSLSDDTDLFDTLGIEGDDASEFMDAFAKKFGVDGSDYRWYFHHGEEGHNFGGWFFKPPYRRVARIAITPAILNEAVSTKRWPVVYPDHRLSRVRWDIRLNRALVVGCLILLVIFGIRKWLG